MSEAAYQLMFTLDRAAHTVTPATVQAAGVWGDHHAAQVQFLLTDPPAGRQYRVEVCDGSGGYDITDLLTPQNGAVTVPVPEGWTAAGIATLRLVEIAVENGTEEQVYHYPPVRLQFEDRADGAATEHLPAWQRVMTEAQTAAAQAVVATERAAIAANNAEAAAAKAVAAANNADAATTQAAIAANNAEAAAAKAVAAANNADAATTQAAIAANNAQFSANEADKATAAALAAADEARQTVGNMDAALDGILAIQDTLLGGGA